MVIKKTKTLPEIDFKILGLFYKITNNINIHGKLLKYENAKNNSKQASFHKSKIKELALEYKTIYKLT